MKETFMIRVQKWDGTLLLCCGIHQQQSCERPSSRLDHRLLDSIPPRPTLLPSPMHLNILYMASSPVTPADDTGTGANYNQLEEQAEANPPQL